MSAIEEEVFIKPNNYNNAHESLLVIKETSKKEGKVAKEKIFILSLCRLLKACTSGELDAHDETQNLEDPIVLLTANGTQEVSKEDVIMKFVCLKVFLKEVLYFKGARNLLSSFLSFRFLPV